LEGDQIRDAVINADRVYLREARKIYTASEAASERLRKFHSIGAEVLYPPLSRLGHLRHDEYGDYVFYPGRIGGDKRQVLLVEAARHLKSATRVVIAGEPRTAGDLEQLRHAIAADGLEHRVSVIPEFVSEEQKGDLFARALAFVYTPCDQDSYGCAALEACHCRKPTITCTDSGGTSLLVVDRVTGRRVSPDAQSLAAAIDELALTPLLAQQWGDAAFSRMLSLGIHWKNVIRKLTS
jgi:glycosyltransferase involved in cell wall biosynthesis